MDLRTDQYASANFPGAVSQKYFVKLPTDQAAFLYASKRYHIPFGWFANPVPSTTSTSWAIYLYYNYNPFSANGSYQSIGWSAPQYNKNDDTGPWTIGAKHATVVNQPQRIASSYSSLRAG